MHCDTRCLVSDGPPDARERKVELIGHFGLGLTSVEVLNDCGGADARDGWPSEPPIWSAPNWRRIIGMRSPSNRLISFPFDSLHERISRRKQQRLTVDECDETQLATQIA